MLRDRLRIARRRGFRDRRKGTRAYLHLPQPLVKIVARYPFRLTKVPVFRGLQSVAINDLRDLLDCPLSRRAGDGQNGSNVLDKSLFRGSVLPISFQHGLKLRSRRVSPPN